MWGKVAAAYVILLVAVLVATVVITETVELLVGKNERDLDRSGRWAGRMRRVTDTLRGAWTLGLAWTFAVFLLANLGMNDTPTAADRWRLVKAVGLMFLAWVVAGIVRAGVRARHSERVDLATRGSR